MAARRVQSLFDNTENYPAYHWNEGLSRAARHYLNEHSACGTSGDIYSMGY